MPRDKSGSGRGTAGRRPAAGPRPLSRARIAGALLAAVATLAAAWWAVETTRAPQDPAAVILISIDTLRADHLTIYGYDRGSTPAIDALAADGVVFDRAYAHSPQTLPSHASILTGRLPFETGVRDNVGFTLKPGIPTLAELLHGRGYATGGVVSAFVLRKETGIGRGFDHFDADLPPSPPDVPIGEVQRPGEASLAAATRWIEGLAQPANRFFLFFHVYEPHAPYTPPPRYSHLAPYDGEIACADRIVGSLLDELKRRGLYDRALIVLLSDHGEGLGDHGEEEHGLFLYDETIRIPLVVKLPGRVSAGRRVAEPVQHIDLLPTILDYTGAAPVKDLRGRSLRKVMTDSGARLPDPGFYAEAFYSRYHFGWSELTALTDARYRFIRAPRSELYDLREDPRQLKDVSAERAQTAAAMRAGLERISAGAAVQSPQAVSHEDLERLQALGYVGTQPAGATRPGDALPDPKDKAPALRAIRRAASLAGRRDYDQAAALVQQVVHDNPEMKDAWLQLGVLLVRAGRHAEALPVFKRLVELDPADANSLVSVAGVLVTLNRLDEARANAALAFERAGGDQRALTSASDALVTIALVQKDDEAARRYAAAAGRSVPGFPLAAFVEGRLLHRAGRFEEALARFQETVRALEGQAFAIPDASFYEGDTLANLGRAAEAEAALRREIQVSPGHLRARASLVMLLRADGRNADAQAEVEALLRTVPTAEGYDMAARTWAIVGEPARANAVRAEAARRFGARAH
jgi:choline-sulfatase